MPILTLAPLAGVGNWVFRLICARLGARVVGMEFINCHSVVAPSPRTERRLDFSDAAVYARTGISLLAVQLYGREPELIARAAGECERRGAQVIDLNFGCSVPFLLRKGFGAAHLQDLDRLARIVQCTVDAVGVPVMVKTRIGWDEASTNVLEVLDRVEQAGARAIAVHARTVVQKYQGRADWTWIGRVRERARIPVLGNGDVFSCEGARAMQAQTGCDAVMVGRAAMANPWIFSGRRGASLSERVDLALEQLGLMAEYKGEKVGVLETRKHLALYFRGLPRTSDLRRRLLTTESLPALIGLLQEWRRDLPEDAAETDLTLSEEEAVTLAWGGSG
jgi:nifR3 family TIM-barrel protein